MSVDLAAMLPGYFQDVMEFQEIMLTEKATLEVLEKSITKVRDNNFIQTCDENTVKFYEQMLNIVPRLEEALEYRKRAILNRLIQRLPYTLPKLKELLDAAVGRNGYELHVRNHVYEVGLNIIEQAYPALKDLKVSVQEMIPAHLLFIFAGKYPVEIPVEISAGACLTLASEFHARYNRRYLLLDNTWILDGTYKLNGYKELTNIDLYPLAMTIRGACDAMPDTRTTAAYCMDIRAPAKTESAVVVSSYVSEVSKTASGICIQGEVVTEPEANLTITVEKDLWYLDGTYLLDGTKLLDAEIIKYE